MGEQLMKSKIKISDFAHDDMEDGARVLCGVLTGFLRSFDGTVYGNTARGEFFAHLLNGDQIWSSTLQVADDEIERLRLRRQNWLQTFPGVPQMPLAYRVWRDVNPDTHRRRFLLEWSLPT